MRGITTGGSYSRDPKTGEISRKVDQADSTPPATVSASVNVTPPAAATKPAKRSN